MVVRASIPISQIQNMVTDTKATVTNVSPTSGQTVAFFSDTRNQVLWITPAATLATLTITLPSEASSKLGQLIRIGSSQNITSLTLTGATMIYNSAASLATGELAEYMKVASNTWVRI